MPHLGEGSLSTVKRTVQVDVHDHTPVLDGHLVNGQGRGAGTCIVEQKPQVTELVRDPFCHGLHSCPICNIAGAYFRIAGSAELRSLSQRRLPATNQCYFPARAQKCQRRRAAHTCARTCYNCRVAHHCPFVMRGHERRPRVSCNSNCRSSQSTYRYSFG